MNERKNKIISVFEIHHSLVCLTTTEEGHIPKATSNFKFLESDYSNTTGRNILLKYHFKPNILRKLSLKWPILMHFCTLSGNKAFTCKLNKHARFYLLGNMFHSCMWKKYP